MNAESFRIFLQEIVPVLLAFGIGAFWLVKPTLFVRGSWKTKPFALTIVRTCGSIMIGFGIAMILKYFGIIF